ncbi:MAG: permease prefix domain 1-containing protein [Vicinamibacteraceae bacterium]
MTWWKRVLWRQRREAQLDAELRDHMERQVADYMRAGMREVEARRTAELAFGGVEPLPVATCSGSLSRGVWVWRGRASPSVSVAPSR